MEPASALLVCTLRKRCHTRAPDRALRIESPTGCTPWSRLRTANEQTASAASSRMRTASRRRADAAPAGMDQAAQTASPSPLDRAVTPHLSHAKQVEMID